MNRQVFKTILGIMAVVVGAWVFGLTIVGYAKGDLNPFDWTWAERGIHLAIQCALICIYAWVQPKLKWS